MTNTRANLKTDHEAIYTSIYMNTGNSASIAKTVGTRKYDTEKLGDPKTRQEVQKKAQELAPELDKTIQGILGTKEPDRQKADDLFTAYLSHCDQAAESIRKKKKALPSPQPSRKRKHGSIQAANTEKRRATTMYLTTRNTATPAESAGMAEKIQQLKKKQAKLTQDNRQNSMQHNLDNAFSHHNDPSGKSLWKYVQKRKYAENTQTHGALPAFMKNKDGEIIKSHKESAKVWHIQQTLHLAKTRNAKQTTQR